MAIQCSSSDFLPYPVYNEVAVSFNNESPPKAFSNVDKETPQGRLGLRMKVNFRLLHQNCTVFGFQHSLHDKWEGLTNAISNIN